MIEAIARHYGWLIVAVMWGSVAALWTMWVCGMKNGGKK